MSNGVGKMPEETFSQKETPEKLAMSRSLRTVCALTVRAHSFRQIGGKNLLKGWSSWGFAVIKMGGLPVPKVSAVAITRST